MHVFGVFQNHFGIHFVMKRQAIESLKKLVIVNMPQLKTPKGIQVFNEMVQFYHCFI
jgi:hypothetical protein